MTNTGGTPAGWYHAPGDPEGTQRYWDGGQWIGDPQAVPPQTPQAPAAPAAPQAPPAQQDPDATVAYRPQPAADPSAGQPPQYNAPPAAGQPPQYGAAPGGAPGGQPPTYGSPPPGGGAPPGYVAFDSPGAAGAAGTLAEGWQRLVARLIDAVIVIVASAFIGIIIAIALNGFIEFFISGLVGLAIGVAYEILLTSQMGATLGKKIFNMRIVNEADGSKVDDAVMLKRFMPWIIVSAIGLVPLIGWLFSGLLGLVVVILSIVWIFTDDKRQSVYDKSGKTIVIVDA